VHTFGVFATRPPLDQIINSVAYPKLPVRIVDFMPGVTLRATCSGSLFVGAAAGRTGSYPSREMAVTVIGR
jgi:transketolase C-terminal domain/subunit